MRRDASDILRSSDSFLGGLFESCSIPRHSRRAVICGSLMPRAPFTPRLIVSFVVAGTVFSFVATVAFGGADPPAKPKTEAAGKPERTPAARLKLTDEQQERLDRIVDKAARSFSLRNRRRTARFPRSGGPSRPSRVCA